MARHDPIVAVLALAALGAPIAPARAQTFEAAYAARLAGVPIGEARLTGSLAPGPYRVTLRGTYGVLGFTGRFDASAEGRLSRSAAPERFSAQSRGLRSRAVEVTFAGGNAVGTRFDPPPEETTPRVPVRDSHRQGVVDPLSALLTGLLRTAGDRDPCGASARVFTGGARFDVALVPGSPQRSVRGEETVCAVRYTPLAGQRTDAPPSVSDIRVAFPVAAEAGGIRLPTRIEMQTRFGTAVIERVGQPARAATRS
jgi:hypothetical protein